MRDWGPPFHDEDASYFIGINRNKRSVGLDLAQPEGREVLLRLLEGADVLIENFKPGSMEKWGIGYDELAKKFPAPDLLQDLGLRRRGPARRLSRLRRHRRRHGRPLQRQRQRRVRPDAHGHRRRRHHDGPLLA